MRALQDRTFHKEKQEHPEGPIFPEGLEVIEIQPDCTAPGRKDTGRSCRRLAQFTSGLKKCLKGKQSFLRKCQSCPLVPKGFVPNPDPRPRPDPIVQTLKRQLFS